MKLVHNRDDALTLDLAERAHVVDSTIRQRRATRQFLSMPVALEVVRDIIDVARSAPSGNNIQPWRVYVVSGETQALLTQQILDAHFNRPADYDFGYKYYPDEMVDPYERRRIEYGKVFFGHHGTAPADVAARHRLTARNFTFFGAPVGLIFTIHRNLERGSWFDFGMFAQNIMLSAKARGLDTCPQVSFARYHEVARPLLKISDDEILVCGMSLGHADPSAGINQIVLPRDPIDQFATFFFDDPGEPMSSKAGVELAEKLSDRTGIVDR